MEYLDIAFGLLLTAGVYCIIPLAVASLCKTSISKKKYIIICIVGEFVIAFAFQYWRTSTGVSGGSFTPAILWGTVFYNVGLSILRKRRMLSGTTPPQQPPEPAVVTPAPDAEPVPAPEKPVPSPPITETWYTCPACGCLTPTGKVCSCGYHPAEPVLQKTSAKKWPFLVIAALAVMLACSAFYNIEQRNTIKLKDAAIETRENTIGRFESEIAKLNEYNYYLKEDIEHLCDPLYADFVSTKFRHDIRNSSNPFVRPQPSEESVSYWMLMTSHDKYQSNPFTRARMGKTN